LKAKNIVIEAGYDLSQLRNDGWPRSGQSPAHPGVVLYFESPTGALCFPCGTYNRAESNIRAIALTLENLRAVNRYGVTLANEQYRGFAALPAASQQMTVQDAAEFIAHWSAIAAGVIIENAESFRAAYRQAAARLHPDITGDSENFYKLRAAKDRLDAHHSLAKAGGAL
jgi:hypothetical protein